MNGTSKLLKVKVSKLAIGTGAKKEPANANNLHLLAQLVLLWLCGVKTHFLYCVVIQRRHTAVACGWYWSVLGLAQLVILIGLGRQRTDTSSFIADGHDDMTDSLLLPRLVSNTGKGDYQTSPTSTRTGQSSLDFLARAAAGMLHQEVEADGGGGVAYDVSAKNNPYEMNENGGASSATNSPTTQSEEILVAHLMVKDLGVVGKGREGGGGSGESSSTPVVVRPPQLAPNQQPSQRQRQLFAVKAAVGAVSYHQKSAMHKKLSSRPPRWTKIEDDHLKKIVSSLHPSLQDACLLEVQPSPDTIRSIDWNTIASNLRITKNKRLESNPNTYIRKADECMRRYTALSGAFKGGVEKMGGTKKPWTDEEDQKIGELVERYGHKWSKISKEIPGE